MQPTDMKRPKRSFPAEISICASTSIVIYDLHSILHNLGGEAGLPLPCPSFLENESALERYRVTMSFSQMGFCSLIEATRLDCLLNRTVLLGTPAGSKQVIL